MKSNGLDSNSVKKMNSNRCPGHSHGISYPGHRVNDFATLISSSGSKPASVCDQKRIVNSVENHNYKLPVSYDFSRACDQKNIRLCSKVPTVYQCDTSHADESISYQRNFQYTPKVNDLQLVQFLEGSQQQHSISDQNHKVHPVQVNNAQFMQYQMFEPNQSSDKLVLTHHVPIENQDAFIDDLPVYRRYARSLDSSFPQQDNFPLVNKVCLDQNYNSQVGYPNAYENVISNSRKSFPLCNQNTSKQHLEDQNSCPNTYDNASSKFKKIFPLSNQDKNKHHLGSKINVINFDKRTSPYSRNKNLFSNYHNNEQAEQIISVNNFDRQTSPYEENVNIQNAAHFSFQYEQSHKNGQPFGKKNIDIDSLNIQQQQDRCSNIGITNVYVNNERNSTEYPDENSIYPIRSGAMELNSICSPLALIRQYDQSKLLETPQFNQNLYEEPGNVKYLFNQKITKQSTPYSEMQYANFLCKDHINANATGNSVSIIRDNDYSRTYELPLCHAYAGTQDTASLLRDESVSRTVDSPCSMTLETPASLPYQVKNSCSQSDLLTESSFESNKSSVEQEGNQKIYDKNCNIFFQHSCLICNISFGSVIKYIEHQEDYGHLKKVYSHFKMLESSSFYSSKASIDKEATSKQRSSSVIDVDLYQSIDQNYFETSETNLSSLSFDNEIVNDSEMIPQNSFSNILSGSDSSTEFVNHSVALSNSCLSIKEAYENDSSGYCLFTYPQLETEDSAYLADKSMTDTSVLVSEIDYFPGSVLIVDKSESKRKTVKLASESLLKQLHYSADVSNGSDSTSTEFSFSKEDNNTFGNKSHVSVCKERNYHNSDKEVKLAQEPVYIDDDIKMASAEIIKKENVSSFIMNINKKLICNSTDKSAKFFNGNKKNINGLTLADSSAYFADVSQISQSTEHFKNKTCNLGNILQNYSEDSIKSKQETSFQKGNSLSLLLTDMNISKIGEKLSSLNSNEHTQQISKPSASQDDATSIQQSKIKIMNSNKVATFSGIFICEICNVRCFGYANYQLHLNGEKHNKKVKRYSLCKSNFTNDSNEISIDIARNVKQPSKLQDIHLSYKTCQKAEPLRNTVNSVGFGEKITRDLESDFEQCLDTQSEILEELTIKSTSEANQRNTAVIDKENSFYASSDASTLKDQTLDPSTTDFSIEESSNEHSSYDTLIDGNSVCSVNSPSPAEFMDISALSSLQPEAASTANSRFFMKNSSKMKSVPQIQLRNHRFIDSPNFVGSQVFSGSNRYNYESEINKTIIKTPVEDSEAYVEDSLISSSWLTAASSPLSYSADDLLSKTLLDKEGSTGYHITAPKFLPVSILNDKPRPQLYISSDKHANKTCSFTLKIEGSGNQETWESDSIPHCKENNIATFSKCIPQKHLAENCNISGNNDSYLGNNDDNGCNNVTIFQENEGEMSIQSKCQSHDSIEKDL
ncbi:unnamed protein product [Meganyctiphanes norvegica]|uniref:C2H2-type domain-containing protein n=1 Tax=Meganyctiphanes norvegica TaxID=48144 RepID=A0AAV2Q6U8_MEGNR